MATLAIPTQGTRFQYGDGGSPETFTDLEEVKSASISGADRPELPATHMQSTAQEFLLGLKALGTLTLSLNLIPQATGQRLLIADADSNASRNFKIILTDDDTTEITFGIRVKSVSLPFEVNDVSMINMDLQITGDWTWTP